MDGKSILSYTLSLPLGEQRKIYIGGSVTDLPGDYCKYSEAVVCKLNNTFAQIVIHPRNSGPIECTNTFNGSVWDGWRSGLSNADLVVNIIPISYSIPASGEATINVNISRNGYTPLGLLGLSGLTSYLTTRQYYCDTEKAYVSVYNRHTTTQTGTCNIRILYKPS